MRVRKQAHERRATHLHSRLIPVSKHFSKRQCWHLFLVFTVTGQLFFSTALHTYCRLARTLLLKKLLHASQLITPKWFPDDLSPQTTQGGKPSWGLGDGVLSSGSASSHTVNSDISWAGSFFTLFSPIMVLSTRDSIGPFKGIFNFIFMLAFAIHDL